MKIINENNRQVRCDECRTLLEYDSSDIYKGYITCPCCGSDIRVSDFTISFPQDYYLNNGVDVENKEIDECVKEGINFLRNHEESDDYFVGTGNTMIFILRNDELEEFNVYVCKNYYDAEIEY